MPVYTCADGREVFYRERGKGPSAMFIHAVTVDSTLWLDQIEGLADIRHCIAPDLLGHGFSDPDPARVQPTSKHFERMLEVFDKKTKGPVDLVGFSAGGTICGMIRRARPDRVRSITLCSAGFPKADSGVDPTHNEIALLLMNEDKAGYYRRLAGYLMAPDAPLFVKARYRSMIAMTRYESIVSFMSDTPTEGLPGLARSLDLPILMPTGEFDHAATHRDPDLMGPNVRFEIVKNAARLVPIEQPQTLNASLRRFWASIA